MDGGRSHGEAKDREGYYRLDTDYLELRRAGAMVRSFCGVAMNRKEQRRIAREYCAGLRKKMLENIGNFPPEYDGFHVRALGQLLVEHKHDRIRAARREIVANWRIQL